MVLIILFGVVISLFALLAFVSCAKDVVETKIGLAFPSKLTLLADIVLPHQNSWY
jgi:hypothetical protein